MIAECCQNHNGNLETLKAMVHRAAESGADYAKIQGLRSSELVKRERFEAGVTDGNGRVTTLRRPFQQEYDRLSKLDLSDDDERWFVEECSRAGIQSMITAFTLGSVSRFAAAGFNAVKIASYDCKSVPLLREAEIFDKVFISTGASFDQEVERAAQIFRSGQAALLHCVTIYPTPLEELNMRRMTWLRELVPTVGFSDHTLYQTTGLRASKLAMAIGADVIERHFTVLPAEETRDGPVSIGPSQFRELRQFADLSLSDRLSVLEDEWGDWMTGLGTSRRDLTNVELMNRDYYSGRVAAWNDGSQIGSDGFPV